MNQLTIVKIGGKTVEDVAALHSFLKDFSLIAGHKILIHGGGSYVSQLAVKLGIQSQIKEGQRITDAERLKVAIMAHAGLFNKNIVAQLQALSLDAVGLTGADMNLIASIKRPVTDIDYGYVGDIREVNAPVLKELLNQNYVPVIAPITHDGAGHLLNTNADRIAGKTAKALTFDFNVRLIYCLEKKGVLLNEKDETSVIRSLSQEEFLDYKKEGIVQGSMIAKLEAAFAARAAGVKEVILLRASHLNIGEGTFIEWN